MRYRKLTSTNDYSFGNGQLDFYIDIPAAVGQAVKTGMLLFLGEWYLNNLDGFPWPEDVLGFHTQTEADNAIQNYILNNITGVQSIVSYTSVVDTVRRTFDVTMTIDTIYGQTQVQVDNESNF